MSTPRQFLLQLALLCCAFIGVNFSLQAQTCDGGMVLTESGEDTVYYCIGGSGGPTSVFSFDSSNTVGANFRYVITDNQGTILGLPPGDMVDVGPAGAGECWAWGLSYTGNFTAQVGDNATQIAFSDSCFDLSDNFVVIFRDQLDGGTIQTESGEDTVYYCIGGSGGPTSVFKFDSTNATGTNFRYVITDNNGTILGLPPGDMVDVGPAGAGECWAWGLSYTGEFTAQVGDNATQIAFSDGCYDLSDNFVVIFRDQLDGGSIYTESGEDTVYYCIGGSGGPTSVFKFDSTNATGTNFRYVITDNNGTILGLPPGDMVDVGPAGAGECWAWGLSYTGEFTAQVGDNATQIAFSDGCYDLSDNFVVIFRDEIDGGSIYTESGEDTVYYCINSSGGPTSVFKFDSTNAMGTNFRYVITDNNGTILGLPPGDMVDVGPAGAGECWAWGLSYTGEFTAQVGDNATQIAFSDGCYDLSDNFVVIFRDEIDGGSIYTESGEDTVYYCIGGSGGPTSVFKFDSTNAMGTNFRYVITDNNGTILGLPPGDMVDVGPAGAGECWAWGLSYTGEFTAQVGDNATQIAFSDGCYDLSDNFVVIFRDEIDGGSIYTESGEDTVYYCIGGSGGPTSVFKFDSTNAMGTNFRYVITDNNGTILGLPPGDMVDVGPAGAGECWAWGLSYTGNFTAQVGDNATQIAFSDGCYDLSDNFVVIFRDEVDGGMVYTAGGMDTVNVCINGQSRVIPFASNNATGANFRYVVTDAQGTILGLPPANMVDFGPAGPGECWVWGLSYTGNFTAQVGDNATQIAFTDGCYDLSDNFVVVFRDSISAGTLTPDAPEFELVNGQVFVTATPNGDAVIPPGYVQTYILTGGPNLIVKQTNDMPRFKIRREGTFIIHSIIHNPDPTSPEFFDPETLRGGTTSAATVVDMIQQGLCADIDVVGATVVTVEPCLADAGTLTADSSSFTLVNGQIFVTATPNGDAVIPPGYVQGYVLTGGPNLIIKQVNDLPKFKIRREGTFLIHSIVFNPDPNSPDYVDPSSLLGGTTSAAVVLDLISQGICADLDVMGASVTTIDPNALLSVSNMVVEVMPNPATAQMMVHTEQVAAYSYQLVSLNGTQVATGQWDADQQGDQMMDLSGLVNGIYQLILVDNQTGEVMMKKIIKQ